MFAQEDSKTFELNLVIRDRKGNITGRKSFATDHPNELYEFWASHQPITNKKSTVTDVK